MALKLTHHCARSGRSQPGNLVRPSELGTLERDALRDALAIVRRFRGCCSQRFRLDALVVRGPPCSRA